MYRTNELMLDPNLSGILYSDAMRLGDTLKKAPMCLRANSWLNADGTYSGAMIGYRDYECYIKLYDKFTGEPLETWSPAHTGADVHAFLDTLQENYNGTNPKQALIVFARILLAECSRIRWSDKAVDTYQNKEEALADERDNVIHSLERSLSFNIVKIKQEEGISQ